jgi:hypothetical protein
MEDYRLFTGTRYTVCEKIRTEAKKTLEDEEKNLASLKKTERKQNEKAVRKMQIRN